jgi:biotin carboxyl carrier protein
MEGDPVRLPEPRPRDQGDAGQLLERWMALPLGEDGPFYQALLGLLLDHAGVGSGGVWMLERRGEQQGLILKAAQRLPTENPAWQGWLKGCVEELLKCGKRHAVFETTAGAPAVGGPFYFLTLRQGTRIGVAMLAGGVLEEAWIERLARLGSWALRFPILSVTASKGAVAGFSEALLGERLDRWPAMLADQVCGALRAVRVSIFREQRDRWHLMAVSGVGAVEGGSEEGRKLESIFAERRGTGGTLPGRHVAVVPLEGWGLLLEFEMILARDGVEKALAPLVPLLKRALPQCAEPGFRLMLARKLLATHSMSAPRNRILIGIGALLLMALMVPVREGFEAECELRPTERASVVSQVEGRVAEVKVGEGAEVKEGEVLVQLDTAQVQARLEVVRQQRQEQEAKARRFQSLQDMTSYRLSLLKAEQALQEENRLKQELSIATVSSPISGRVLTKDLQQKRGVLVRPGESICEVGNLDRWTLQVALPEEDVAGVATALEKEGTLPITYRLRAGADVELKAALRSASELGQMAYPVAGRNVVFLTMDGVGIPDELKRELRPGFSGKARLVGSRRAWGISLTRRLSDYLHLHWWL